MVDILMTHLPKGQLIGIHNPDTIYPVSIGTTPLTYTDLGVISAGNINVIISLGNGIALAGTSDNHIFRSTDYGNNWFDEGAVSASAINTFSYIGNGIVIFGNSGGQIRRSTDFGITWSAALFTSGGAIFSSAYLGGGVVLAGTSSFGAPARGHIIQSLDYGATWADVAAGGITVGGTDAGFIDSITFIDSPSVVSGPIVIFTDSNGRLFQSTDGGTTWASIIDISVGNALLVSIYIGNNIVITVDNNGAIFRSIDRGATWNTTTVIGALVTAPTAIIYLGSGIVAHGGASSVTKGSYSFGLTWADFSIASSGTTVTALCYLGNGVVVAGAANGKIFISDIAYKTNEAQVNYPRIPSVDLGPTGTAARVLNTTYTNSDKTRSLLVRVYAGTTVTTAGPPAGPSDLKMRADPSPTNPPVTDVTGFVGIATLSNGSAISITIETETELTAIIRPNFNYRVVTIGTVTLLNWFEMYI
jgi:hypothetical protein